MIRHLFAVLVLVPIGLAAAQDGDVKKEMGKLQGVWQVQTYEEGGANPSPDFWRTVQFVIKDKQLTIKGNEALSEKASRILLVIDPATKPAVIDFKIEAGTFKGTTLDGIYEVKGDDLKICLRGDGARERPSEFATKSDSQLILFTLKRAK